FELRTGAIIFVYTFLLAPILHSLLGTVSTDTIYALATIFLFLNWAFLDYTTQSDEFSYKPGSNTTALSSSLLAALCLASRLATSYHTFVLIAAATTLFILWPLLVRTIRLHAGRKGQIFLTFFTCIVSNIFLGALAYYETTVKHQLLLAFTSILIAFCLNFLGPWLLVRMQRMKRNIHGPWDEAVAQS
ncbi:unnamed protein product, partial [Dicrocoelium dendriticum]